MTDPATFSPLRDVIAATAADLSNGNPFWTAGCLADALIPALDAAGWQIVRKPAAWPEPPLPGADKHNAALLPIMKMIVSAAPTEADQWLLLESLCLGVGVLHSRNARATATFIEVMAERIATGERAWVDFSQ